MLDEAIEKWDALPESERRLDDEEAAPFDAADRWDRLYPKDGLVLRSYVRDLPRDNQQDGWRRHAWNTDTMWIRDDEAGAFIPDELAQGSTTTVPETVIKRLAAYHLVDAVRGQVRTFHPRDIEHASLTTEIGVINDNDIMISMRGSSRTSKTGKWPVKDRHDAAKPTEQRRGVEVELLGLATFDRVTGRFTTFELVAIGTRWGGTQYNARWDDLDEAPIAFVFELADDWDRIPPSSIWEYGW